MCIVYVNISSELSFFDLFSGISGQLLNSASTSKISTILLTGLNKNSYDVKVMQ
jgi:membrane-anchored protein YejM (alkaline phosphatase superfamily)